MVTKMSWMGIVFGVAVIFASVAHAQQSAPAGNTQGSGEVVQLRQEIQSLHQQAVPLRTQLQQLQAQIKPIREQLRTIHEKIKADREKLEQLREEHRGENREHRQHSQGQGTTAPAITPAPTAAPAVGQ